MGLFKDVKKPVIRQAARGTADISPLRPRMTVKQAPCGDRCPVGIDVRGWLATVAQAASYGRTPFEAIELAWRMVADANPFPAILGRICPAPCEKGCHRAGKDGSVAVNALERALGDMALVRNFALPGATHAPDAAAVAVVGGGPAGLSCAYQLARHGHRVTVFEAADVAGGRLRDAIRSGRISARVVDAEIARVVAAGIAVRHERIGAADVARLSREYAAVFIAAGRGAQDTFVADEQGRTQDPRVLAGGDMVQPGLVAAAIAGGRRAAAAIDALVAGRNPGVPASAPGIDANRLTLDWYQPASVGEWTLHVQGDIDKSVGALDAEAFAAEAGRCLSCGLCMDCEQCWMFCANNCFEKLPKGQHYRVNVDTCNGCRKCADQCPCGFIEMV